MKMPKFAIGDTVFYVYRPSGGAEIIRVGKGVVVEADIYTEDVDQGLVCYSVKTPTHDVSLSEDALHTDWPQAESAIKALAAFIGSTVPAA